MVLSDSPKGNPTSGYKHIHFPAHRQSMTAAGHTPLFPFFHWTKMPLFSLLLIPIPQQVYLSPSPYNGYGIPSNPRTKAWLYFIFVVAYSVYDRKGQSLGLVPLSPKYLHVCFSVTLVILKATWSPQAYYEIISHAFCSITFPSSKCWPEIPIIASPWPRSCKLSKSVQKTRTCTCTWYCMPLLLIQDLYVMKHWLILYFNIYVMANWKSFQDYYCLIQ